MQNKKIGVAETQVRSCHHFNFCSCNFASTFHSFKMKLLLLFDSYDILEMVGSSDTVDISQFSVTPNFTLRTVPTFDCAHISCASRKTKFMHALGLPMTESTTLLMKLTNGKRHSMYYSVRDARGGC